MAMACVVVVMAILSDSTPDRKREREGLEN